jgi:hypothetical protein
MEPYDFDVILAACLGYKERVGFRFPVGSRTDCPFSGHETREEYEARLPKDFIIRPGFQ